MIRPLARRRGGPLLVTAGFLGVGGSFALLGGAGPWRLGTQVTSGLTLVMLVASVFGFGVASPVEQVLSRRLNAGGAGGTREPLTLLLVAGLVTALVGSLVASQLKYAHLFHPLVPGLVLAVVGWVAVVSTRYRLAGAGDLWAYASTLVAESATRVVLIGSAIADPTHQVWLLAAAVGVPLLVGAAVGAWVHVAAVEGGPDTVEAGSIRARVGEQGSFVAVSFCYQVCLNALTLVLGVKGAASQTVSAVGVANSYFLAPTVIMGGVTTHALVSLSHAWGRGDMPAFLGAQTSSLRRGGVTAVAATGLAILAEPVALPFYYHHPLRLPVLLLVSMAVSTVITVVAVVAIQPLLAAGRGRPAALAWMSGAAVTVGTLALSTGTNWLACLSLVVGPAIALAGARMSVSRVVEHWPTPHQPVRGVAL